MWAHVDVEVSLFTHKIYFSEKCMEFAGLEKEENEVLIKLPTMPKSYPKKVYSFQKIWLLEDGIKLCSGL